MNDMAIGTYVKSQITRDVGATQKRDHGGGLDDAIAAFGGTRRDWLDLSTGINPVPYPVGEIDLEAWTALPDRAAYERLTDAARSFWSVPDGAEIIAAPGASSLIAKMPELIKSGIPHDCRVRIDGPTYNEHAAAFEAHDFNVTSQPASVHVQVHPNNPDGRLIDSSQTSTAAVTIIDESFCDTSPQYSLMSRAADPGTIILKSFGKFWGLAGLRLGFAIAHPDMIHPKIAFNYQTGLFRRTEKVKTIEGVSLPDLLGPWPVAGPALEIGARALSDRAWATETRARLAVDADRLDTKMQAHGAKVIGGTPLFRLYEVDCAAAWQNRLAEHRIWSRTFPYNYRWLRLGLPAPDRWEQLDAAL